MRLISCDIENFGGLSNLHLDFSSGCNVICRENGWGKSTLAAFFKVMFYGFDNAAKRDDYENERRRYTPWQGGVYGGKITFEANGHSYILTRTFGAKETEDSFILRDGDTNLETDVFSENIGVDLFKIDSVSFMRSVYISQNDCETKLTDSINAKLGNLAENTDDINNFEKVDKQLKDILNKMSPKRITGSLSKIKSEITALEQEIKKLPLVESGIEENKAQLLNAREAQENIRVQIDALNEEVNQINALIKLQKEKDSQYKLTSQEEKEYENLHGQFAEKLPENEEVGRLREDWIIRLSKKENLLAKKMYLTTVEDNFRKTTEQKPHLTILMWVLAAVMVILAVPMFYLFLPVGAVAVFFAIVFLVMGFVVKNRPPREAREPETLIRLREEIVADEEFIALIENKAKEYIISYGYVFNSDCFTSDLERIVKDSTRFKELLEKKKQESSTDDSLMKDKLQRISELNIQIKMLQDRSNGLTGNINQYLLNISRLEEEYDDISRKVALKEETELRFEQDNRKYILLGKAKELLNEAKISFSKKYMEPITKGFNKYYSVIAGNEANKYIIDANGEILVEEKGATHDKKFMSTGFKDLIGICMRMAFVDAMYQEEKPFIIFDDPFVNLDDEKTSGGIGFINNISEEYQVIYFTCHKSRTN